MTKRLHIVCLDVPFPPDYGGAMEMFYKIKALKEQGIAIVLHVFDYGRGKPECLKEWCNEVHYYDRLSGHKGIAPGLPYIVSSRANPDLLNRLLNDKDPILFEGLHTTYWAYQQKLANRKILVRLHNLESTYYQTLGKQSRSMFQKLYAWRECRRLRDYEKELSKHFPLLAITGLEAEQFKEHYPDARVQTLPAFVGWEHSLSQTGIGNFCLYHGNLAVPENEKAAIWLLNEVFNQVEIPLVIAGKNPSATLERIVHRKMHTCLVSNPSVVEMQDLIKKAQIHVLPAMSETGIKFKLLNAVFCGRHCIVNKKMTAGTQLEPACYEAKNASAFQSLVMQLFRKPFEEEEIEIRNGLLKHFYNNQDHARQLIQWIW